MGEVQGRIPLLSGSHDPRALRAPAHLRGRQDSLPGNLGERRCQPVPGPARRLGGEPTQAIGTGRILKEPAVRGGHGQSCPWPGWQGVVWVPRSDRSVPARGRGVDPKGGTESGSQGAGQAIPGQRRRRSRAPKSQRKSRLLGAVRRPVPDAAAQGSEPGLRGGSR